jgi:catechol 2,3-dioxygenase-like lactoylglutathione lyase family enzyme
MASQRFSHVAISCKDPLAVERWYTKHFGFQRARVIPLGDERQIVFIRSDGMYLELFQSERTAEDGPVTVVIARRARPDRRQEFEGWLKGICDAAAAFPGHLGAKILPPRDANEDYIVSFRFDSRDSLRGWESSTVRAEWLERGMPVSAGEARTQAMLGSIPEPDADGLHFTGWRHIAFQVDDVDAKLAEIGEDAQITLGPLSFDAFIPGWRTVWVRDPNGNVVEISQGYNDQENPPPLSL